MESIAGIKIYLLIERFWTALKKNKKMKDASTKKVTETCKFIKWYGSDIVGDKIVNIIGPKKDPKKIIYKRLMPSFL